MVMQAICIRRTGIVTSHRSLLSFVLGVSVLIFLLFPLYADAQSVEQYIATGDSFANKFEFQNALSPYRSAVQLDSNACDALWKSAETYLNLGEDAEEEYRSQYYYLAEAWAQKTVRRCPDEPNGYFFVAAAAGLLSLEESGRKRVARAREIKEALEKVLELDPGHDGAYHALGRWHREVAGLSWFLKAAVKILYGGLPTGASNEKALQYLQKATAMRPNWINHHKELGITYMQVKDWPSAASEFETALVLPLLDHQDELHKQECREYLQEAQKKLDR
jgi:tetratricopeptide (TPR) repeat protein